MFSSCTHVHADAHLAHTHIRVLVQLQDSWTPGLSLPGYLLRVIRANAEAIASPSPASTAQLLVLCTHACMLETGFQLELPGGVAAVRGKGSASPAETSPYTLPEQCRVSASIAKLQYRLPLLHGATNSGTPPSPEAGRCTVQCSTMGESVVVAAGTPKGHPHHISVHGPSFLASPGDGGAVPADLAAAAVAGEDEGSPASVYVGGRQRVLTAAAAGRLWTALKDGIAFPMLLAVHADAGLPPPAGLLALPQELRDKVLKQLSVSWVGAWVHALQCRVVWCAHGSCPAQALHLCAPEVSRPVYLHADLLL
jgi:hypothetical protein